MVAERAAESRVSVQQIAVEEAQIGQDRIQRDGRVSLPQEEAVAIWPPRLGRTYPQELVVEGDEDFDDRERRAVVAAAADVDEADDLRPDHDRPIFKPGEFRLREGHDCSPIPNEGRHYAGRRQPRAAGGLATPPF